MNNFNGDNRNPYWHQNWQHPNPQQNACQCQGPHQNPYQSPYRDQYPNQNPYQSPYPDQYPNQNPYQEQGLNQNEMNGFRRISIEEAMNIALEQVPGQVVSVEQDTENGVPVYEVEIVTQQSVKYEVNVDLNTGEIVNIELD